MDEKSCTVAEFSTLKFKCIVNRLEVLKQNSYEFGFRQDFKLFNDG